MSQCHIVAVLRYGCGATEGDCLSGTVAQAMIRVEGQVIGGESDGYIVIS